MTPPRTRVGLALLLAGVAGASACSLGGREFDVATVDVDLGDAPATATTSFTGELTLITETMVSPDGLSWFRLTLPPTPPPQQTSIAGRGPEGPSLSVAQLQTTVLLQRGDSAVRVTNAAQVPLGTYRYVRLVVYQGGFARVSGSVGGTSVSNDSVAVDVGTAALAIEREVPALEFASEGSYRIQWDLNAEVWLTAAAVAARRTNSIQLRDAVTVTVTAR